jgi:hypothetical protein
VGTGSNDDRGKVTTGGSVTSCTLTFNGSWASAPFCTATIVSSAAPPNISLAVSPGTATLLVSFSSSFNGSWSYVCQG